MKTISGKTLCKILVSRGWKLKRINGSHHIFSHPDNPNILTVPVHGNRDLKRGTLTGLLDLAELTEKDI
ncbi:MAG: Predicted RNA binding protein YcfA, dsRBD-like fold, HicA-like mRNA interferase family [Candidatus Kentron sp. G]|nr:MAG: Predicted RNA binding protein YcfA, dsRBD-like fold, HicA-like mRNA interferase family [Candidatus Kentron sp. G]VFM96588.1 MAG: Predicted RNA binding protein YcfA, dsRBD-like fold, HicA-like mRNA interferase family [Candidatus Kentron sp. G]VFM98545.1 MAG: Predicted RNA binding protein YcfA, dsRBD-like fold, HicA-like mRNA interferase family [Candidatus Kentron sp. G]